MAIRLLSNETVDGSGQFAGVLKITETGTAQHILIGNQDSGGTNKPGMIRSANASLEFGYGNSWSGEGGTMTTSLTIGSDSNATFAGDVEINANLFSTGQNLKFHAAGTHVLNIDVNRHVYPNTHNSTDLGFSRTLAFRDIYMSGVIRLGGYSYIGEDLQDQDSLTIGADATEGLYLSHYAPGTNTWTTSGLLQRYTSGTGTSGKLTISPYISGTVNRDAWLVGVDDNHSIKFRVNGGNKTYYYSYGGDGTDIGHQFYTGGLVANQSLRLGISNDRIIALTNVGIGTTSPQSKITYIYKHHKCANKITK